MVIILPQQISVGKNVSESPPPLPPPPPPPPLSAIVRAGAILSEGGAGARGGTRHTQHIQTGAAPGCFAWGGGGGGNASYCSCQPRKSRKSCMKKLMSGGGGGGGSFGLSAHGRSTRLNFLKYHFRIKNNIHVHVGMYLWEADTLSYTKSD